MTARRTPSQADPELRALLAAAVEETAKDAGFDLTPTEAELLFETGELPPRVEQAGRDWEARWRGSRK
jgi:hypothetical protein